MNNAICERCERETGVIWRCQQCGKGVCRQCIETKDNKQVCADCAIAGAKK